MLHPPRRIVRATLVRAAACLAVAAGAGLSRADDAPAPVDPAGRAFFEEKIRPVFVTHCYQCHSAEAEKLRGGLLLDSRWGWQQGGESGPAIVPGQPQQSLLINALHYDQFEMPPKAKLPKQVIADFEEWVNMGAPDPREKKTRDSAKDDSFDLEARKAWWSQ